MMENECRVIRDLLPLFLEGQVSEGTAASVKRHLESCRECSAAFEEMRAAGQSAQEVSHPSRDYDEGRGTAQKKHPIRLAR